MFLEQGDALNQLLFGDETGEVQVLTVAANSLHPFFKLAGEEKKQAGGRNSGWTKCFRNYSAEKPIEIMIDVVGYCVFCLSESVNQDVLLTIRNAIEEDMTSVFLWSSFHGFDFIGEDGHLLKEELKEVQVKVKSTWTMKEIKQAVFCLVGLWPVSNRLDNTSSCCCQLSRPWLISWRINKFFKAAISCDELGRAEHFHL